MSEETVDGEPVAAPAEEEEEGGLGWVIIVGVFALLAALLGNGNDGRR